MYIYISNILWLYLFFYQFNSLCLNFIHLLVRKPIFENFSIFSNKFFHNFHLSESVLLVQGFGQVVWREDWFKSYLFICNFASFINYEWANDYWLWPCEQFLKIYHGENKITFCWDDNACFVLDHAAHQVWFLYTSLARMKKKKQLTERHVAPIDTRHIIPDSQSSSLCSCILIIKCCVLSNQQSLKWKFEFFGPIQILEVILYIYLNKNWKIC